MTQERKLNHSVDPDDLDLPSERHRRILMHALAHYGIAFHPQLSRMGIVPSDVSGRLVMLYDETEFIDAFDAGLARAIELVERGGGRPLVFRVEPEAATATTVPAPTSSATRFFHSA